MCACVVGEGRKCLCTCGQGEGQVVSRGPSSSRSLGSHQLSNSRAGQAQRGHSRSWPRACPSLCPQPGGSLGCRQCVGWQKEGHLGDPGAQPGRGSNAYKLAWRGGQQAEKFPYRPPPLAPLLLLPSPHYSKEQGIKPAAGEAASGAGAHSRSGGDSVDASLCPEPWEPRAGLVAKRWE